MRSLRFHLSYSEVKNMTDETLRRRIALWKSMSIDSRDETDAFIDALVKRVEELEDDLEDAAQQ
jgi:hypothetical protein